MDPALVALGLMWLLSRKDEKRRPMSAPTTPSGKPLPPSAAPAATPSPKKPGIKPAAERQASLVSRAYTKRAQDWIPTLERAGASKELAAGLARWIGIESGGNSLARSKLGERGLLQAMEKSAVPAFFTPVEWAALASPKTDNETHARLALKQFAYHVKRALGPGGDKRPVVDQLFYAKLHHAYPKDLTVTKLRPPATQAVQVLPSMLKTENQRLRLASATVIAFGKGPTGLTT